MSDALAFGPFHLDVEGNMLFHDGVPTALGGRAVTLLGFLVSRPGTLISKQALFDAAWPGQAVEDSNLTVQIASIRKTLEERAGGAGWIETLPRRGYRYTGPTPTSTGGPLRHPDGPSIAVLPFSTAADDPSEDYFAEGMVEDIVNGLARINRLLVIARASTVAYKGKAFDVAEVGRRFGVRYVLLGSVRRAENRLRVSAQLIDADTGVHIWSERYDRGSDDIFSTQDEIAIAVLGAIAPSLRRAEIARVQRKRPDSMDAYDLVLQAQRDVDSGMPEQVGRALVLLSRAIELEPDYALAHGNAAMCHHSLFLRAGFQEVNRAASIRHAREALRCGRDDATALALAGFSIGMDGHDRGAALTAFETALDLSPSSALAFILGSVVLGWGGEAERAIEWSERGMRLSPFDPWAFAAYDAQAMSHLLLGHVEEACRAAYRSVQANPAHSITHVQLAAALATLGRMEEARNAAARVRELQPGFRYGRQFAGVNCAPALAQVLGGSLRAAGLPE